MSTILYESLTTMRQASDPTTPVALTATAADGTETKTPTNKLLDLVAAVVPVEILAAHGALLAVVSTSSDPDAPGPAILTITSEVWAERFWALLVVFAALFYIVPHALKAKLDWWDIPRTAVPAMAFAAWTMLQPTSLFNPVSDWPALTQVGIAVFLGLITLLIALLGAGNADKKPPAPGDATAPVAGGALANPT